MAGEMTGQNGEPFEYTGFGLGDDYTERLRHVKAASEHLVPDPEFPSREELAVEAEQRLEDDAGLERELVLLRQEARVAAMKAALEDPDDQTYWSADLHEAVLEYERLLAQQTDAHLQRLPEPFRPGGQLEAAARAGLAQEALGVATEEIAVEDLADYLKVLMDMATLGFLPEAEYNRAMSLVSLTPEGDSACVDCQMEERHTATLQGLDICRQHARSVFLEHRRTGRYSDQDFVEK